MSMNDLLEAFELIEIHKKVWDFKGEPKSEELIDLAEQTLSLKFSPTYRSFLKIYGCGAFNSIEIDGIYNEKFQKNGYLDSIATSINAV